MVVEEHATLGRRLLATRDLRQGEVVLVDRPAAVGPLHTTTPLCLECSALLPRPSFACPCCGFPLCAPACVGGERHLPECRALATHGTKVKILQGGKPAVEYQVGQGFDT